MAWHQRHQRAYRKALEAAYGPPHSQAHSHPHSHPHSPPHSQAHGPAHSHPHSQEPCPSSQRYTDWNAGQEDAEDGDEESSSDSEIECDVSNMVISEELREYFAHSEKHRVELKKQQQIEAEEHESYVPADQDLRSGSWRNSMAPPSERPGERRGAEMKKLYGEDAAKIQAMEAAMQLNFDRHCDLKQPKYWPVIPLKL